MTDSYLNGLRRNVKIFYISKALGGLLFTVPVWVAFHQQYLNYSQMAVIAAVAYFVTLSLELPTGALADLIGRKRTIVIGQILIGIFRIFLAFAIDPMMFFIGWIGEAIGNAFVSGSDTALLYDSLKETGEEKRFPKIIAKSSLLMNLFLVLAVFSGGYFYEIFVGLPFILRGVVYLLMSIISLGFIEPKIDSIKFTIKNYISQTQSGVRHLLRSNLLRRLAGYYIIVAGVIWVLDDYFVNTFAKDSGYTEIEQSWAFAAFYLISTLVVLYITRNEDKMPSKKSIYIGLPILLVASLIPGYFAGKILVFFLILGINIASIVTSAILDNYVNEDIDSAYRATALSALNLGVSGVYILVLLLTGPLQDLYSNRMVWSLIGVVVLLILVPLTHSLLKKTDEHTAAQL